MHHLPEIKTHIKTHCMICGIVGSVLYKNISDQLFSAPGKWSLSVCSSCKLLWLNPYPIAEELGKIYSTYYTHQEIKQNVFSALINGLKVGVYKSMGYRNHFKNSFFSIGQYIPYFNDYTSLAILKIHAQWGKKLLDLGCGNGDYLNIMRGLGWSVEGVEPDTKAAAFATQKYDLKIHVGNLPEMNLPENSFDVITLNHVIEHIYEPEKLLVECRRILKPGGRIVLLTPNTQSLGYKLFKKDWRGLEVPRHIAIFSVDNFRLLAQRAGLGIETLTSTARISRYLYSTSVHIKQGRFKIGGGGNRGYLLTLKSYCFQILEEILLIFDKKIGEEIYFVGKKL